MSEMSFLQNGMKLLDQKLKMNLMQVGKNFIPFILANLTLSLILKKLGYHRKRNLWRHGQIHFFTWEQP